MRASSRRAQRAPWARGAGGAKAPDTPVEKNDTLFSAQVGRVVDLISEGPIKGLVTNDGRSIYLDGTPLLPSTYDPELPPTAPENTPNYKAVSIAMRPGTSDQLPIPDFAETETPIPVGVQIFKAKDHDPIAVIRNGTTPGLDAVVVNLRVGQLFETKANGDIGGAPLLYRISLALNGSPTHENIIPPVPASGVVVNPDGSWTWTPPQTPGYPAPGTGPIEFPSSIPVPTVDNQYFVIRGKASRGYGKSHRIVIPPGTTEYSIKIEKLTDDSRKSNRGNSLFWDSIIEVVDSKFSYPHRSVAGIKVNAEHFPSIPTRAYHARGVIVDVPSNRISDPGHYQCPVPGFVTGEVAHGEAIRLSGTERRAGVLISEAGDVAQISFDYGFVPENGQTFAGMVGGQHFTIGAPVHRYREYVGDWDGTYQQAWTDNPAWLTYAIMVNKRWGLGERFDSGQLDRWSLYRIGRYCDELVPDGKGGLEPRFTLNAYIQTSQEAFALLQQVTSVFRGIAYWCAGQVVFSQDRPQDPILQFTAANVVDGVFAYSGTGRRIRHTVALVRWNDPADLWRPNVSLVEDVAGIERYGVQTVEVVAFGTTSAGQAARLGRWTLLTNLNETETVGFRAGLEAAVLRPGMLFSIVDPKRGQQRFAGRLRQIESAERIELDREITLADGVGYSVMVQMPAQSELIQAPKNATSLVLGADPSDIDITQLRVWADLDDDGEFDLSLNDVAVSVSNYDPITNTLTIVPPGGDGTVIAYRVDYLMRFATVAVSSPAGAHSWLDLAEPLPALPAPNAIWMLSAPNQEPTIWRCASIKETENGAHEITATAYFGDKFEQVENGLVLDEDVPGFPATPLSVLPAGLIAYELGIASTPHGAMAIMHVSWAPSPSLHVVGYDVRYRRNEGNWTRVDRVPGPEFDIENALPGLYEIEVVAVGIGFRSGARVQAFNVGEVTPIDLTRVTGLEIFGQGNDRIFTGHSPRFAWRIDLPTLAQELDGQDEGADTVTIPPWFDGYQVEIWDDATGSDRLRRVERVWDPSFAYTVEMNTADAERLGGPFAEPVREWEISVRAVDTFGNLSPEARITVRNPGSQVPTPIPTRSALGVLFKYDIPADADFRGVKVFRSTIDGFIPSDANLFMDVSSRINPIVVPSSGGIAYHYIFGAYDAFSRTPLFYSAQISVAGDLLNSEDLEVGAANQPFSVEESNAGQYPTILPNRGDGRFIFDGIGITSGPGGNGYWPTGLRVADNVKLDALVGVNFGSSPLAEFYTQFEMWNGSAWVLVGIPFGPFRYSSAQRLLIPMKRMILNISTASPGFRILGQFDPGFPAVTISCYVHIFSSEVTRR